MPTLCTVAERGEMSPSSALSDGSSSDASGGGAAVARPNILFFFTDDQRFDTIHALGNERIITPNLDTLVRTGTTFTNAYIMGGTCPAVCMPSRAMLMTGRGLFHLEEEGQGIPEDHIMLGEVLQQAGYVTFGTGKWHSGTPSYARSFSTGAEIFFGGMDDHWNVPACDFDPQGAYPQYRQLTSRHGALLRTMNKRYDHIRSGVHSSDLFCGAVIDFLQSHGDQAPFFAYVSFMAPHDPRETHQKYHDLYDPATTPLPPNFMPEHPFDNGELWVRDEKLALWPRTPKEIRQHVAEYYAMITHLDAEIGRVLEALRETGHAEDTIIVLAGDNGLAVGRHGLMGKQNLYEHSVHVPLIMSGPGIPKGVKSDALCYLLDIFPTLCDLAKVPVPQSVEGKSLVAAMREPAEHIRDTLFTAYRGVQRGVRDERFKLIEYAVDGGRTTQLFDLQADVWEVSNLADDPECHEPVQRLRAELLRWRDEAGDTREKEQDFWLGYDR